MDIIGKRFWFFLLSAIVIVPGIVSLSMFGLKIGIDFKSGSDITLHFDPSIQEGTLRSDLAALGYHDATVQRTGAGDFLVRLQEITNDEKVKLTNDLADSTRAAVTVKDFAVVSPVVASQTARNATAAVLIAAVGILLYITWAFRRMPNPLRWGTCAVIALVHDMLVVLGIFSILGWAAGVRADSLFITAMLTVAGYSVHDTIVVFDRVRENTLRNPAQQFDQVVNYSVVQTLVRSLNTSLTVFFVLFALFLLGGTTIHYFVLALLIGVITGTYSSIYNASALLVVWEKREWRRFISWVPFARTRSAHSPA